MTALASHPQRNSLRLLLRENQALQGMSAAQWSELEPLIAIADYRKGDPLVRQGDEVMAHTITLHLLDAPGRLARFQRKHPELAGRIPKKELAAYLNLTPETLSRLKQKV